METFWWGSTELKKTIHWCSWAKLCESKDSGDMGFRDLSLFNQAMLAKQSWRLVKNPNSLAARVIRERYYPVSNFLQVDHYASGSFVWRSLLWGCELLEAGSRWRIGTRSSVSIYSDRWIPRPHSFRIQSQSILGFDATVRCLISPSGSWNDTLIRASFPLEEAEFMSMGQVKRPKILEQD
ncbi:hypothetical protein Dsin_011277 [Dipteronia sinensis]|uniref:Uncharacterized protein n=1 Tax=Dipteronia sinensis TaxID=43782 RepID=A0AAE0AUA7_9ROSI|nr:hypothetical protein Dsin_011277 [Dipteronia sinensis]